MSITRSRPLLICAAVIVTGLTAAVPGAALQVSRTVLTGVYSEDQAKRGEAAFKQRCTMCHGTDLQGGDDPNGPPLRGRGFTYRWRNRTVGDLFAFVQQDMPANDPGTLTPDLAADLTSFILKSNLMPAGESDLPADAATLDEIQMAEPPAKPRP